MEACPVCLEASTKVLGCGHAVCDTCYFGLKQMAKEVHVDGEVFVLDADMPTICPLCRASESVSCELVQELKSLWGREKIKIALYQEDIEEYQSDIEVLRQKIKRQNRDMEECQDEIDELQLELSQMDAVKQDHTATQQSLCELTETHMVVNTLYHKLLIENENLRMQIEDRNPKKRKTNMNSN